MIQKKILTDCDGVLLWWETAFHQWMTEQGYNKVQHGTYDLSVAYDLHRENKHDVVKEFNNSAWICCLEPFRDALSGVARLVEAGYTFDVITSLSTDPYARKLRQQNLDSLFGKKPWHELICLETGGDKDHALEPYRDSGLYWIEDKWENAVLGAEMGLTSILINHPHNQHGHHDMVTRVDNWQEIVSIVLDHEDT